MEQHDEGRQVLPLEERLDDQAHQVRAPIAADRDAQVLDPLLLLDRLVECCPEVEPQIAVNEVHEVEIGGARGRLEEALGTPEKCRTSNCGLIMT